MMDSESATPDDVNGKDSPAAALKQKRLSNGTSEQDSNQQNEEVKSPSADGSENGFTCNGSVRSADSEEIQEYDNSRKKSQPKLHTAKKSKRKTDRVEKKNQADQSINGSDDNSGSTVSTGNESRSVEKESLSTVRERDAHSISSKASRKSHRDQTKKVKDKSSEGEKEAHKDGCSDNHKTHAATDKDTQGKKEDKVLVKTDEKSKGSEIDAEEVSKEAEMGKIRKSKDDSEKENRRKADSEKDNHENNTQSPKAKEASSERKEKPEKRSTRSDSTADDIEIIGESKIIPLTAPNSLAATSQNLVFVPSALSTSISSLPLMSQGYSITSNSMLGTAPMQNTMLVQGLATSSQALHGLSSGFAAPGMPALSPGFLFTSGITGQQVPGAQNVSLLAPAVAPPKPKSSLDQIELIRWEIQNRINTRPKYFKPNPSSELGPLAKFLFDIGSDLIKESVYHDLVKIQSKKNEDNKLTDKEREDLEKLKEIEKDLFTTIGHLKFKLKKRCKICSFQTESNNVMYLHKQYPHEDNKLLRCAYCSYCTKQAMAFKFHMEAEHNIQPKLQDKKAFYECDMCPYENNQEQKLILHKQRCIKQFRPLFNLHPSCLSGAEINLCLENIFYKPIVPKNLKLLQQKHAQQQAALAEARRQQAQMQALAAQKNAAAIAAKKQHQQRYQPPPIAPRYNPPASGRMSVPPKIPPAQPVRYNANVKGPRPTVANMLSQRQNAIPAPALTCAPGGFEVCEICGGYVKDRKALRIHFFYAHRIDLPFNLFERNQAPLYCATCYVRFWTAQGLRKHIDTHKEENQTRGVVGKCISCGHHVLNLLLHMRIVHNREIQHYINALMCMFCGSHFGCRQECERHIIKAHGNVDPVTGTLKANSNLPLQSSSQKSPSASQKKPGNNSLVKGSVCVLCNLNFGRNVDLTRHCMRMHHTCMKCGMVVIDKASLMKHTCLSSPSGTRDCSMCGETGFHPAYYVKHLRDKHLKKFSIKVTKLSKIVIERWTKRPYSLKEPQEILVEISDSEDDDVPLRKLKPLPSPELPRKKPRIGPACKVKKTTGKLQVSDVAEPPDEGKASPGENNDTQKPRDNTGTESCSKEATEVDNTRDANSADEDSLTRKRKSVSESPGSDKGAKRKKSSSP